MPPITVSTEVERSTEDVYAYATDPTLGARCRTTRRIGFANRSSTSEVAHISPPATWGVREIGGPIRAIVDVTVEPLTARRSRLTIAVDFEGHGIGQATRPARRAPRGPQGDAGQPSDAEGASRTPSGSTLIARGCFASPPRIRAEARPATRAREQRDAPARSVSVIFPAVGRSVWITAVRVGVAGPRAIRTDGQELVGGAATAGEGNQNLLCAYLAAAVLVGLLANTVLGWWWLDPIVALGIAGLAVREGIEAWQGEDCC